MKPWSLSWTENGASTSASASQKSEDHYLQTSSGNEAPNPDSSFVSPVSASTMSKNVLNFCKNTCSSQPPDPKALAASRSHSEAERRRRERINNHLSTLRTLLPNTTKTDKASLLAEVIERIKELKQQVAEISEFGPVPSDVDELNVDIDSSCQDGKLFIKASICCNDRPNLLTDLVRTLKSLHLRTVKAEMATMEGRTKNVFVMTIKEDEELLEPTLACVEEALRSVMEESSETIPDQKRARVEAGPS